MIVCAFDVSTTCTGYAVCDVDGRDCKYVASGRIRKRGDPVERAEEYTAVVVELALEHREAPDAPRTPVIVEIPSSREYSQQPGMGTLGFLAGFVFGAICEMSNTLEPIAFYSDDWKGKGKKARQRIVQKNFPQYTSKGDGGMDESDALAMILLLAQKGKL